jgi:DNA mismatch repair protein MutL
LRIDVSNPAPVIRQLSPALVNRIAAGEVIERPASVVKELLENAVDAGATSILVEVEDGGRELIRVIDDGCGISPEQLPLAFASHATSKISCDEDLFRIGTMGFRGEALASIGSVSHARILSRTREGETAFEIVNRGGDTGDVQAAAGNCGTCIEVRNLFFNVPARRKFLKGTGTEFGYISEQVLRTSPSACRTTAEWCRTCPRPSRRSGGWRPGRTISATADCRSIPVTRRFASTA